MTKKVFAGWAVAVDKVAGSVEAWFRQKGYEVQAAGTGQTHVIQARTASTWRTLLGNSQSMVVKVEASPAGVTAEFGAGTWVKNLKESGAAGVAGAVAAWLTFGMTALTAASERSAVEVEFWKAMEVGCRGCGTVGAGARTGESELGMTVEPGTPLDQNMLKGVQVYVENYRCTKCEAVWSGQEQRRTVSLCPGCNRPCKPAEVGKTVVRSYKEREAAPGVFEGWLVYCRNYRCPECSHLWVGPEVSKKVQVCPACEQPTAGTEVRREVTGTVRREEVRVARTIHRHEPDTFGGRRSESLTEYTVPVEYEVSVSVHRCEQCSHEWTGGQHERRLG